MYRPWKSDSPDKLALGPRGWVSLGCLTQSTGTLKAGYWIRAKSVSRVWWELTKISWLQEAFSRVRRDSSGANTCLAENRSHEWRSFEQREKNIGKRKNVSPSFALTHFVSTLIARQSTKNRRGLSGLCVDNPFLPTFFNFPFTSLVLKAKIKPESQQKLSIMVRENDPHIKQTFSTRQERLLL